MGFSSFSLDLGRVPVGILFLKGGNGMTIKMIAVDMDGTFLNDQKKYNEERFKKLFDLLQEKEIKFVVASGNQYFQLRSFFPDLYKSIAFVAENGANILIGEDHVYHAELRPEKIVQTLDVLEELAPMNLILCGKQSAYLSNTVSQELFERASFYYPKLEKVEDLYTLAKGEETIFKFALSFDEQEAAEKLTALKHSLGEGLIPVSSGHGDIDLIIPGVHKLNGLRLLGKKWGISEDEIATFGDSGNDFEMIQQIKHSFAMENGQPKIKEAATTIIGSNNTEAVLDTIQAIVEGKYT